MPLLVHKRDRCCVPMPYQEPRKLQKFLVVQQSLQIDLLLRPKRLVCSALCSWQAVVYTCQHRPQHSSLAPSQTDQSHHSERRCPCDNTASHIPLSSNFAWICHIISAKRNRQLHHTKPLIHRDLSNTVCSSSEHNGKLPWSLIVPFTRDKADMHPLSSLQLHMYKQSSRAKPSRN